MSSTTTTITTKPTKTSLKHLSPKDSTSSLPGLAVQAQKHVVHQDSLSAAKSGPIITNVAPTPNRLSPQASFSRDDPRGALLTALFNNIEGKDDRARASVARCDTVSSSAPSLAIDTRSISS